MGSGLTDELSVAVGHSDYNAAIVCDFGVCVAEPLALRFLWLL